MENRENDEEKKLYFRKKTDEPLVLPKTVADKQRLHIEKLMRNPEKPVYIPDKKREWNPRAPAEFVRDVMGSSAGAGSGEFHVYRGYRRREFARQSFIQNKAEKEENDEIYHEKLEQNQIMTEAKTAKKRAKRLKQKQKMQAKKMKKEDEEKAKKNDEGEEEEEEEEERERKESKAGEDSDREGQDDDAEENCFVIGGR